MRPPDQVSPRPAARSSAAPSSPPPQGAPQTAADTGSSASPKKIDLTGRSIGGYRVTRMLGAGGMGAVCLAHQVSLDRPVALKILPSRMAKNPDFLMRFTREALSAAQLTHHNIVQIYDIGHDAGIHYISMEYVRGENLSEVVRRDGAMDPRAAAGYILQAARGLHYAHQRGIIHRDIKPDNMMLNEQGILKIADMGLAKIRTEAAHAGEKHDAGERASILQRARGDLTMSEVAMGTPAYMPPEQARDATAVDHRADQYSLGCTLYFLIAGKAPYSGTTAYELICKHMTDPLPPLRDRVPTCPLEIVEIVNRMMGKEPEDRYPSMKEVMGELETFLGVESERGAYSPRDIHVKTLEEAQREFYQAPSAGKRRLAILGFYAVLPAMALLLFLMRGSKALVDLVGMGADDMLFWARTCLSVALLTPIGKFIFEGVVDKNYMFRRVRSVLLGMTMKGWILTAFAALLTAILLRWALVVGALLSGLAAGGYHLFIKQPLRTQRRGPIERVQQMLKELRIRGVSEEALKDFVAKFSGNDWEEFFEEIFGFEAMLKARAKWGSEGEGGKPRKRASTWRDPLADWLDAIEEKRRRAKEREQLMEAEAERLKAEGVAETDARAQANEEASRIMREGLIHTPTPSITPASFQSMAPTMAPQRSYVADSRMAVSVPQAEGAPRRVKLRRASRVFLFDQWIRLWAGIGMCVIYAVTNVLGLPLFPEALGLQHYNDELGLGAGIMLIISAFSTQATLSSMILGGAVLVIGKVPISNLVNNPSFSPLYCMGVGVILMLIGFVGPILRRLTGERY